MAVVERSIDPAEFGDRMDSWDLSTKLIIGGLLLVVLVILGPRLADRYLPAKKPAAKNDE